jgi:hypothetical protein
MGMLVRGDGTLNAKQMQNPRVYIAIEAFLPLVRPWFREGQRAFIRDLLLSERMRSRELFDHTFVERMLRDHLDGRSNYQAQIFTLASLELWFRVFIDPTALDAPQELLNGLQQECQGVRK